VEKKMKVIIGNGKVSNILREEHDIVLTHKDISIEKAQSVDDALANVPWGSVVINTAAKINLEWCEENKADAELINTYGAMNVGLACRKYNHHLVHISSGCIFDGLETEYAYSENEKPTPASWYAHTKAKADAALLAMDYYRVTVVRPRQLISAVENPTNMLTKFLGLGGGDFIDSKNSLTCIEDMKEMIDHLVKLKKYGIYNLANEGVISPYEIAMMLKENIDPTLDVRKISYSDYVNKLKVKRVNTILDTTKLKATGYKPRTAQAALEWCIENYGK
jgi:dTDP-4-dehydrorhamnose reductase